MRRGFGFFILQIGLALFFLVNGLFGLINSDVEAFAPVVAFFTEFFPSLFANRLVVTIMVMTISVCEIIVAVFLLLDLFSPSLGFVRIILIIFTILWAINIVLVDGVVAFNTRSAFTLTSVLSYLKALSPDLMIFGTLLSVSSKKRSF